MKITAQAGETPTSVALCTGVADRSLPSGLVWTRKPMAQTEPLLRSAARFVANRGNIERTVVFEVSLQQSDLATANAFALTHDAALAALEALGPVSVLFEAEDEDEHSFTLENCIIEFKTVPTGLDTTTSYTITGATLTDTTPEPEE